MTSTRREVIFWIGTNAQWAIPRTVEQTSEAMGRGKKAKLGWGSIW